jgi:chorismate dehydratase
MQKLDSRTKIKDNVAGVVIGDRAFSLKSKYKYVFDLSEEWFKMTALPFVFATWVANKPIDNEFIKTFNNALQYGLDHLDKVVKEYHQNFPESPIDLHKYLTQNIDFVMDEKKKQSMKLFYDLLVEQELLPQGAIENIRM